MQRRLQIRSKYIFCFIFLLYICCFSNSLSAQQLLGIYEFQGDSGSENQNLSVSNRNPYTIFSNFYRNTPPLSPGTLGKDALFTRGWLKSSTSSPDHYLEFTVSAGASYQVHIDRITFEASRSNQGPSNARIATNIAGSNYDVNFYDFTVPTNPTTIPWDGGEVILDYNQSVTFRFFAWNAGAGTGNFRLDKVAVYGTIIPYIRINEFHYATSGTPQTDFVEVIVPKSFTNYAAVKLSVYNYNPATSSGTFVQSETLDKFLGDTTLYDDYNVLYLNFPNGLPDPAGGLALSTETDFIQFLSYGTGTNGMGAVDGPVASQKSLDVGVTEEADDGINNSIFLSEGRFSVWTNNESGVNTKGLRNGEDNIILPVELMYFRGENTPAGVLLTWATATEKDNDKFIVERSNNTETDFKPIIEVKGHGSTLQEQKYQFFDKEVLSGITYYRLKQIDFDGKYSYSIIVAVSNKEVASLSLFPNPTNANIRVTYQILQPNKPTQLLIYNIIGTEVYQGKYTSSYGTNTINLELDSLPAGTYILALIADGKKQTERFIKR